MLQLAPVAAAAAPSTLSQSTPGPAAAKATAGSKAGAVIKAVALAANKAAGKFKSTAPQPKPDAANNTGAAPAGGWCRHCLLWHIHAFYACACVHGLLMNYACLGCSTADSSACSFTCILTWTNMLVYSLMSQSVSHTSSSVTLWHIDIFAAMVTVRHWCPG